MARLREEAAQDAARLREETAAAALGHAAPEDEQVEEVEDMPFSPTLDRPHPRVFHVDGAWLTSFPPPADLDVQAEWRARPVEDCSFGDITLNPDPEGEDPLALEDLDDADRWPASPGYARRCTIAERAALDRWVERQLAPVHAEHARFFDLLGRHGAADDSAALTSPPAPTLPAGEPCPPFFVTGGE